MYRYKYLNVPVRDTCKVFHFVAKLRRLFFERIIQTDQYNEKRENDVKKFQSFIWNQPGTNAEEEKKTLEKGKERAVVIQYIQQYSVVVQAHTVL